MNKTIVSGLLLGCFVAAIGLGAVPAETPVLDAPAALPRTTRLIRDGRPLEILHPDTETGRAAARTIAEAVKQATGVAVTARPGLRSDRLVAKPAVILGNLYNNPAFELLYAREQTLADEFLPGPGGYLVESLIEPVRRDADILIVGASDDAGLRRAAEIAAARIRSNCRFYSRKSMPLIRTNPKSGVRLTLPTDWKKRAEF